MALESAMTPACNAGGAWTRKRAIETCDGNKTNALTIAEWNDRSRFVIYRYAVERITGFESIACRSYENSTCCANVCFTANVIFPQFMAV